MPGATRRGGRAGTALLAAVLLLTGCGDGEERAAPAHPVFSLPVGSQPGASVEHTRKAGTARFRQVLTLATERGHAALTTAGQLDFARGRAVADRAWTFGTGFRFASRRALLGSSLAGERAEVSARVDVSDQGVDYRPEEAPYWIRYASSPDASGGPAPDTTAIDVLRPTGQAPLGQLLLEAVHGNGAPTVEKKADGGRVYTTSSALYLAERELLPPEVSWNLSATGMTDSYDVVVTVDPAGRVTRIEADLSGISSAPEGELKGVTGLRMVLTLTHHGAPVKQPPRLPAGDVVDAAEAVAPLSEVKPGECVDALTGLGRRDVVVRVPCEKPHDIRVFAQRPLDESARSGGSAAAGDRATSACAQAHADAPAAWTKAADPGRSWTIRSDEERNSGHGGGDAPSIATCYVKAR